MAGISSTFSQINHALYSKLPLRPASDDDIRNASCARRAPFSSDEMLQWLETYAAPTEMKRQVDVEVNGISFHKESPALIELFKKLTTAMPALLSLEKPKQEKFKSQCDKVLCAAQEMFGKKVGLQLLFMLGRFGMNGSTLAYSDHSSPWTSDQLDDVLLAMSDFPSTVMPVEIENNNYRIVHFDDDDFFSGSSSTLADSTVTVFHGWDEGSHAYRRYVIAHELGHVLALRFSGDHTPEWLSLSHWTHENSLDPPGEIWKAGASAGFVSRYAKFNPSEDFAESVATFRYNPERLKQENPEKYEFIRDTIFDGLEYTSKSSCSLDHSITKTLEVESEKEAIDISPSNGSLLKTALSSCGELLMQGSTSFSQLKPCLLIAYNKTKLEVALKNRKAPFDELTRKVLFEFGHFSVSTPTVSSEDLARLRRGIVSKTKKSFVDLIEEKEASNPYEYDMNSQASPREFCQKRMNHIYELTSSFFLSPSKESKGFDAIYGGGNKFFSYKHQNDIARICATVCERVQSRKSKRELMSKKEIEQAVDAVFKD